MPGEDSTGTAVTSAASYQLIPNSCTAVTRDALSKGGGRGWSFPLSPPWYTSKAIQLRNPEVISVDGVAWSNCQLGRGKAPAHPH